MAEDEAPCPLCEGRHWIITSEEGEKPCKCHRTAMIKKHLGPEILTARSLRSSPLYVHGKSDRTKDNLFIKGSWHTILSHLQWALGSKFNEKPNVPHRFKIETDEKIVNVFVGNHSFTHRPKSMREDVETFNALSDFVEPPDLFILRLGFLGYPNKAAPGSVKQALGVREVACKPTWIIESPSNPFGPGHFTYSEDLAGYIDEHFEVLDLSGGDTVPDQVQGGIVIPTSDASDPDSDEVSMGGPTTTESVVRVTRERIPRSDSFDMGTSHQGGSKWKKKGASGGPGGGDF